MFPPEQGKNILYRYFSHGFISFLFQLGSAVQLSLRMMKRIAPDKWRHFYAGIILGAVLQAFLFFVLNENFMLSILIAFAGVVAVSYGFELFSKITGMGHHDVMDAIASIIGGVAGMGLVILVHYYL